MENEPQPAHSDDRAFALSKLRELADTALLDLKLAMADGTMPLEKQAEVLNAIQQSVAGARWVDGRLVSGETGPSNTESTKPEEG